MKLTGDFEFIGVQEIQGRKDPSKTYHNVALMQGVDVVKIFLNDEQVKLFSGLKRMERIHCDLSVNVGSERSFIGVDAVKKMA